MFTGIIQSTGRVEALRAGGGGSRRLSITTELDLRQAVLGASLAVNGVCLTLVEIGRGRFAADLGPETLALTTLGDLQPGDRVHLEPPLRLGDPLGGHLVAGHVDGVGTITARIDHGDARELEIAAPPAVAPHLVVKGSIAVDGISLTVNRVQGVTFSVTLIPHTLSVTCLGSRPVGARVNLESDLIAKHVERLVAARLDAGVTPPAGRGAPAVTVELLRKHGYAP